MTNFFSNLSLRRRSVSGSAKFRRVLILITVVAIMVRFIPFFSDQPIHMRGDEPDYYLLAKKLYEGKGFVAHEQTLEQFQGGKPGEPTAYRTVILPAFIAAHFFVFGEHTLPPRISLILLSALCCLFIAGIGKRLYNAKTGLVAAGVWALYPPCVFSWYTPDRLLTENISIFFILVSFYFLTRIFRQYSFRQIILAGLFFGLAVLTRGYLLLTIPLIVGYLFFFAQEKRLKTAFFFGLFASILVAAWMTRNYFVMGKPVLSTQTDSFYWGHNDWSRGSVYGDIFEMPPWKAPQVQGLVKKYPDIRNYSEIELSEIWSKEGFQYMKTHPKKELWLAGRKTVTYILPFQTWAIGFYKFHYVYFILLLGTLAAFWYTKNRKEFFLILLPFLGGWIASLLTVAMDRYRFTVEPLLIITGVYGLMELASQLRKKSNAAGPGPSLR